MIRKLALRTIPAIATRRTAFVSARRFYSSESAESATSGLVAALRSEEKIEKESIAETEKEDKEYFGGFLESNGFKLVAPAGSEEVHLVRQVGSETVKVFFNISDVINSETALEDEDAPGSEEDSPEDFDAPVRMNVVVERPAGAIGIEAYAQDSTVVVESITPYESGALATDESAEADYKRRQVYQGPPFTVLDPSVQSAVKEFLESRNVDSDLALFISEYSSYKENLEYTTWLGKIADVLEK